MADASPLRDRRTRTRRGGRAHQVSLADRSTAMLDKLRTRTEAAEVGVAPMSIGTRSPNHAVGGKADGGVGGR